MTAQSFMELAFWGKMLAAMGGGFISFVSPCVLPLVPSYISFITGISFEELVGEDDSKRVKKVVLTNSIMFILGFSAVFILILGLSAQLFGQVLMEYRDVVRKVGGIVIILLGVHVIGVINIGFLQREKRLHFFREGTPGVIGSFLVGVGFAAGWTPCIGPILSAIFTVAATSTTPMAGILLFIAYSLGLAIPFLLTALCINAFLRYFQKVKRYMRAISIVTGLLLILTGVLIFTNSFAIITTYLYAILPAVG